MATQAELITQRDAAVSDYAAKLAAFRTSYVELAALDIALGSQRVGHQQQRPGFGEPPDPVSLRHAIAAPTFGGRFSDDIGARVTAILAAFPTPGA